MAQQPSWQQFAGSIAENYHRYLVPAIFGPWTEDLVALAALQPGDRVLDVAAALVWLPGWPPAMPVRAR